MSTSRHIFIAIILGTFVSGLLLVVSHHASEQAGKSLFALQFPGIYIGLVIWGVHRGTQFQIESTALGIDAFVYAVMIFVVLQIRRLIRK